MAADTCRAAAALWLLCANPVHRGCSRALVLPVTQGKHWLKRPVRCCAKAQPSGLKHLGQHRGPAFTLSPTFTRSAASAGIMTSTREPNLISPTRCPRSTVSPGLKVEDDASRQQAGDLFEHNLDALVLSLPFDRDHILLVAIGRTRGSWRSDTGLSCSRRGSASR